MHHSQSARPPQGSNPEDPPDLAAPPADHSSALAWTARQEWLPLAALLLLQTIVVIVNAQNTAFQDEALYIYAGRQIFDQILGHPVISEPWALRFTGLAYIHPLLIGIIDQYLGLEATRLLSLAWMLLATVAVYDVTRSLFDREAALLAAAVFTAQGPVLFLGGLATHDAMTVGLLGAALMLTIRAGGQRATAYALALGAVLFLAVLSKYGGLLFIPSVFAFLGWHTWQRSGRRMAIWIVGSAGGVLIVLTLLLLLTVPAFSASLIESTLARIIESPAARRDLIQLVIEAGGPLILIALGGLVLVPRRLKAITVLLVGTLFLAPVYHIYKEEPISLFKHLAYGSLFGAPVAGYVLARLIRHRYRSAAGLIRRDPWIIGLAVCLLLFGHGLRQADIQYRLWPNAHGLVELLQTQIHPGTRILAEEAEVPRYYLQDVTSVKQWDGLYWFEYQSPNGVHLSGDPAYRAAIDDGYFDIVVLRFGFSADRANEIAAEIEKSGRYTVLARIPFTLSIGDGAYTVWINPHPGRKDP